MTGRKHILKKTKLVIFVLFMFFVYIITNIYIIQIIRHDELLTKAKKKYTSVKITKGIRGEIYDYQGNLLVGNVPCYDICADPQIIGDKKKVITLAKYFSRKLNINGMNLLRKLLKKERIVTNKEGKKITKKNRYALIKDRVDFELGKEIKKELKKYDMNQGIFFSSNYKRYYPKEELLANLLGFTKVENGRDVGIGGIEKKYSEELDYNEATHKYERGRDGTPFVNSGINLLFPPTLEISFTSKEKKKGEDVMISLIEETVLVNNSNDEYLFTEPIHGKIAYNKNNIIYISVPNSVSSYLISSGSSNLKNTQVFLDFNEIIQVMDEDSPKLSIVNNSISVTLKEKEGENVYLTIIEPIQAILENELDYIMKEWSPRATYGIMVEPRTGSIIAVAQRPTFNPNDRSTMQANNIGMRFVKDVLEPGSTMKAIAISGALDLGVVKPNDKFDCEKGIWYYMGKPLHDAGHAFYDLTVTQILQKSSNIGTAKIAIKMGKQNLYNVFKRFGLGTRTGVNLQGETRGILRDVNKWDSLSISRFPIGQGVSVSPLQLTRAYCALANGGRLVQLRVIDRIENTNNKQISKVPIAPTTNVFRNRKTHKQIIEMMKLVTQEGGTAKQAAIPGYYVAGKTGTSQKWINTKYVKDENEKILKDKRGRKIIKERGHYSHKKYFASFIGFAPADNPKFVLFLTADEPKRKHYGGVVVGPSFRKIGEKTLKYFNTKRDY